MNTNESSIQFLKNLFTQDKGLKVPSYQRAYAWEEQQLTQFAMDILNMTNKGYYYGHFIMEKSDNSLEIIDGQQRITTFILFLMVCSQYNKNDYGEYIEKFETVSYDQKSFKKIQSTFSLKDKDWELSDFNFEKIEEQTISIGRIIFALNFFSSLFKKSNQKKLKLEVNNIDSYITTLLNAHISTHLTEDKAVSVQIFELQNSRGIKLSLIEKVKAKLMKEVYLNTSQNESASKITEIQNCFAEVYQLEELVSSNSFRGDLSLEEILLHHLRIVNNGLRTESINVEIFRSPSRFGNREENILKYIDDQFFENSNNIVKYITDLVTHFKETVKFVSINLPKDDRKNGLIGDVLILDKALSIEFFILLFHKNWGQLLKDSELIRLWEILIYTRDFHDKYHRLWSRDDFEKLFQEIAQAKSEKEVKEFLKKYVEQGFRPDRLDNHELQTTVVRYLENHKDQILGNAFHWWQEKMVYLLYKYEKKYETDPNNTKNLDKLRKIMKGGRSIEHILPQQWQWVWIGEQDAQNISEKGQKLRKEIDTLINGVGNLLLISPSENSSLSNNHPKDKEYKSCDGGSYKKHNDERLIWEDHSKWPEIIKSRGEEIYNFLLNDLLM